MRHEKPPVHERELGVFALAMICVSGIFSLRSMPTMAEYGFSSVFFYLLAALIFFIPAALVCAELATGWPKNGGIYVWVKEAMGERFGFLTIWFEWTNTIVWFPTVLSYIAATLAFTVAPSLAEHKYYMVITMLSVFWGLTLLNFLGVKVSGWVSSFGIFFGTLIPALFIISLGIYWLIQGEQSHISFSWHDLLPHIDLGQSAFLAGLVLSYAGAQVAAFHAQDTRNPQRDYPRAMLLTVILVVTASVLGTLAVAIVIPRHEISLVAGLMQTFSLFFTTFHMKWIVPILAVLTAFGAIAAVNTWLIGPSKGLLYTANEIELPKIFHRFNRHGVPVGILFLQAIIGSILSMVYLFMPTVNSSYWLLSALTSQLTMFMYILMFIAAIVLRFTKDKIPRAYRIPGGKIGMIIVAGMGLMVSIITVLLGFIPPSQLETGNIWIYEGFLVGGITLFTLPAIWFFYQKRQRDKNEYYLK